MNTFPLGGNTPLVNGRFFTHGLVVLLFVLLWPLVAFAQAEAGEPAARAPVRVAPPAGPPSRYATSPESVDSPDDAVSPGDDVAPGVLAVRLQLVSTELTRAQVFRALEREFDTRVVATEGGHGLHLAIDGRTLRASFVDPGGAPIARTIELPVDTGEQVETIALLSGNLARDETGELLVQLYAKRQDVEEAEREATRDEKSEPSDPSEPPATGEPESGGAEAQVPSAQAETPSPVEKAAESETPSPKPPVQEDSSAPLERVAPSFSLHGAVTHPRVLREKQLQAHLGLVSSTYGSLQGVDLTLGLSTNLGLSPAGSGRGVQLSVVHSRTDRTFTGATGSVFFSSHYGYLRGAQVAALVSYRRADVLGAQLAGLVNAGRGSIRGAQLAGVTTYLDGNMHGIQGAIGGSILTGDLSGAQGAVGTSITRGRVDGVQGAVGFAFAEGGLQGFQFAGVTYADSVDGAQLGLVNVTRRGVDGAQIGVINVTGGDSQGSQIGLVNIGGKVHGSQFGLLNIAKDVDDIAFAPVNIVPGIRNQVLAYSSWAPDAGVEGGPSTPLFHVGMKFVPGPLYTQLTFGVGAEAEECPGNLPAGSAECLGNSVLYAGGFAAGIRGKVLSWLHIEADAQYQFEKAFSSSSAHGHGILGRLALSAQLTKGCAMFAGGGPRLDLRVSDSPNATVTPSGSPHFFLGMAFF